MSELFDFQKYELMNDNTYTCQMCNESFQCFSSTGDTLFCPNCGCRADNFDEYLNSEESEK